MPMWAQSRVSAQERPDSQVAKDLLEGPRPGRGLGRVLGVLGGLGSKAKERVTRVTTHF